MPFVVLGCPALIGALTNSGVGQTVAFVIASLLAVYLVDTEAEGKVAISFARRPHRYVGDRVWLVEERLDSMRRVPAYLVDIAAEGARFKYLGPNGEYDL